MIFSSFSHFYRQTVIEMVSSGANKKSLSENFSLTSLWSDCMVLTRYDEEKKEENIVNVLKRDRIYVVSINIYCEKWSETILVACVKLGTGNKIIAKWIVRYSLLHAEWISAIHSFKAKAKSNSTPPKKKRKKTGTVYVDKFSGLLIAMVARVNVMWLWNKGRNIGIKSYTCVYVCREWGRLTRKYSISQVYHKLCI